MAFYFGTEVNDADAISDRVRAEYETFQNIASRELTGGYSYSTGHIFKGLSSGTTVNIFARNPSDSGMYLFVFTRFITDGKFYGHKSLNVSPSDDGTQLTIEQRRSDIADGNVTESYHSATVDESNARVFTEKVVGSSNVSGANVDTPEALLAPGDNIYLEAESAGGDDITLDLDFIEIPQEVVDSLD